MGYSTGIAPQTNTVAIKVPVFSTEKLPQVEVSLGPEMRSTGEVLGVGQNFHEAMYKGFTAAGTTIPKAGSTILVTVREMDKENFLPIAKKFHELGASLLPLPALQNCLKITIFRYKLQRRFQRVFRISLMLSEAV